jgi:cobalt-zinc-cadmium efflux system outer membrane protein
MENAGLPGQQLRGLNREISTYVTWPLEPLIQRPSRVRRAEEDVHAAEASVHLARRQVTAAAVRAFFRVALAQEVAEETEHEREMLQQLAAYNRDRVDEGVTAEAEFLRIQVEVDRATTDVVFAQVELSRAVSELAPYLGDASLQIGPPLNVRVAVPNSEVSAAPSVAALDVVLTRARAQRPELVMGRARAASLAATEDYERSLAVRQIGATAGSKRIDGQNSMVVGISVAVPLFNRNRGGIARAASDYTAATQELAWTDRTVAANVQGAHAAATQLTRQLGALQQTFLARADEIHRLTLGAYQEGGATLLQVLDATRIVADARLTFARTLFAQREALVDLALASGAEPTAAVDLLRAWSAASTMSTTAAVAR